MLGRLLIGIVKGVILGGLLGFGVAKLGFPAPPALIAYLAAAVAGVLVGLIAGKPIWAKDAKMEAGMKAVIGALLASGLMYAARRFLTMPVPIALGPLGATAESANTVGALALTSVATVAGLLGGFYEADNTPGETADGAKEKAKEPSSKKRIAPSVDEEDDEEAEGEADKKQRAKR
jgi:chromate transport protein ChrA